MCILMILILEEGFATVMLYLIGIFVVLQVHGEKLIEELSLPTYAL